MFAQSIHAIGPWPYTMFLAIMGGNINRPGVAAPKEGNIKSLFGRLYSAML